MKEWEVSEVEVGRKLSVEERIGAEAGRQGGEGAREGTRERIG